jgi:hypothetical protein
MPKEDYLIKYLEKLARAIAAMLGMREKGSYNTALEVADETFREMISLSLTDILNLSVEDFELTIEKEAFTATFLDSLARLAYQTYLNFGDKGEVELHKAFAQKALVLYRLLNRKDKTFSFERESIIAELESH